MSTKEKATTVAVSTETSDISDTEFEDEDQELLQDGKEEAAMSTKERATVAVSTETSDISDTESDEDQELLQDDKKQKQQDRSIAERLKSFLTFVQLNWKNSAALACLWIAYFLCTMAFSLMSPFFPQEARDRGISSAAVGLIIATAPGTVAITSPLLGYLLPLVGIPIYTSVGLLLVGTSYLLMGIVIMIPSPWGLILVYLMLRVAEGTGTAMFMTATFSIIPKLLPNSVGTMVAIFGAASGAGYTLGRPLGGFLYLAGGFKVPFLSIGVTMILLSIPCTLFIRKIRIDRTNMLVSKTLLLSISLDLFFIVVALGLVIGYVTFTTLSTILEPFLIQKFQMTPLEITLVFLILSATEGFSNFPAGIISDKMKNRSPCVTVCGLAVAAVGQFIIAIQDYIQVWRVWIICVGYAVIGVGGAFAVVPTYSNLIRIAERYTYKPEDKVVVTSFVAGVLSACVSLGQCSGLLFGGVLNTFLTLPETAFIVGEIASAMGLLLLGVYIVDYYSNGITEQHTKALSSSTVLTD